MILNYSLQRWKEGVVKPLPTFPTAPAPFQQSSACVTSLGGFHLAHRDLQCDRRDHDTNSSNLCQGQLLLQAFWRKFSPLFPQQQINHYIDIIKKVPGERMAPTSPVLWWSLGKGMLVGNKWRRTNSWFKFAEIPHIRCEFQSLMYHWLMTRNEAVWCSVW